MRTEFKSLPVEWKASDTETGVVEAVVSVFGNVDYGGDRVLPGAFTDTLKAWGESGDPIPFIWAHDWNNPDAHIGFITDAKETPEGLWVRAKIDTDRPFAAQVLHLLKQRRVKEFSFGYGVKEWAYADEDGQQVRELKALDLYEAGPCLLGMNDSTRLIQAASRAANGSTEDRDALITALVGEVKAALLNTLQDDAAIPDTDAGGTAPEGKTSDDDAGTRDTGSTIDHERLVGLLARPRHTED